MPAVVNKAVQAYTGTETAKVLNSFAVGNNEVAFIEVAFPTTGVVNSITDGSGVSWTFVAAVAGDTCRSEVWRYVNTSGASITVSPTINQSTGSKAVIGYTTYSGSNTAEPIGTTSTTSAQTVSPTAQLNLNAANSLMIGNYATNGEPAPTLDASDTDIQSLPSGGSGGGGTKTRLWALHDNTTNGTAGQTLSTAGTWSFTSKWCSVGVELKNAPAGATTTPAANTTNFFMFF